MSDNINRLILGDNLEILKRMDSESVDLVYLDPPFFSNRTYEVIWGDDGEVRSFQDRWSGGVDHYIAWLKERVAEMHRVLKPSGAIFLHCDWHANAYIRVEILDKLFGYQNFRNEIIWKRADTVKGNFGQGRKAMDYNTDTIFYYAKSETSIYKQLFKPYTEEYIKNSYKYIEEVTGRRYQLVAIDGPGGASKGNPQYEIFGITRYWRYSKDKMQELIDKGIVIQSGEGNVPRKKQYLDKGKGVPIQNMWDDISALSSISKERIGYPTQKPESLLHRIIEMSTNEGDCVLDPFVGGGTTVAVADRMNRRWVGIDQSVQAVKVTEMRLNILQGKSANATPDIFSKPFTVTLHKYDYDTLRYKDAFEFESWIVIQYGGTANAKQRVDLGLDGKTRDNTPIQVKRSDNVGRNVIDNFHSALMRYDKALYEKNKAEGKPAGFIIAFSFGKGAVQEVARLHNQENVIIKLVAVEEIVPISKKPNLTVEIEDLRTDDKGVHELVFRAAGESAAGIEFYSWDFDFRDDVFRAEILLYKKGEQTCKFKAGSYNIAVKVFDNDGLENTEVIKLKVNGKVERQ